MIKLDEQSLNSVVGGVKNVNNNVPEENDTRNEEFMEGFCKFPKRSYKTVSNVVTGKNLKKSCKYTPAHRAGEAVGMAVVAMTIVGLWEAAKFTLE